MLLGRLLSSVRTPCMADTGAAQSITICSTLNFATTELLSFASTTASCVLTLAPKGNTN